MSQSLISNPVRILLIDDHALVRTILELQLKKIPDVKIIGEAETGEEGVRLAKNLQPDLIILDLQLPDVSGWEVLQRISKLKQPIPKILILSSGTHDWTPKNLSAFNFHGYLSKSASIEELSLALKAIFSERDQLFVANNIKQSVFKCLNFRELKIIRLTIKGMPVHEIAGKLHLDIKTIYAHRSRVFKKLGVKNEVELAHLAFRNQIIYPEDIKYSLRG